MVLCDGWRLMRVSSTLPVMLLIPTLGDMPLLFLLSSSGSQAATGRARGGVFGGDSVTTRAGGAAHLTTRRIPTPRPGGNGNVASGDGDTLGDALSGDGDVLSGDGEVLSGDDKGDGLVAGTLTAIMGRIAGSEDCGSWFERMLAASLGVHVPQRAFLSSASTLSARCRSSSAPCANWHLTPYGHLPCAVHFSHMTVL